MGTLESPFESYKSKQILSFACLMCPSVSRPKLQSAKKGVCDLPYSISAKLHFEIELKKYGAIIQKSQKILGNKKIVD